MLSSFNLMLRWFKTLQKDKKKKNKTIITTREIFANFLFLILYRKFLRLLRQHTRKSSKNWRKISSMTSSKKRIKLEIESTMNCWFQSMKTRFTNFSNFEKIMIIASDSSKSKSIKNKWIFFWKIYTQIRISNAFHTKTQKNDKNKWKNFFTTFQTMHFDRNI